MHQQKFKNSYQLHSCLNTASISNTIFNLKTNSTLLLLTNFSIPTPPPPLLMMMMIKFLLQMNFLLLMSYLRWKYLDKIIYKI